jgi:hypothetical protein
LSHQEGLEKQRERESLCADEKSEPDNPEGTFSLNLNNVRKNPSVKAKRTNLITQGISFALFRKAMCEGIPL